jgi:hypothetical protein
MEGRAMADAPLTAWAVGYRSGQPAWLRFTISHAPSSLPYGHCTEILKLLLSVTDWQDAPVYAQQKPLHVGLL